MQNNKIAQIVYRTIYITLGFIGIIGSFGYFNRSFNQDFYVMYTNLSNYFCIGVTLYLLIKNIRNKDENKIVGMPSLDLSTSNLIKTSNTESEVKVPTFEVPAPNIPVNVEPKVDVNNNVPLNEEEVNSILAGNNIDESIKEDVSEVIINEPSEPTKIANSTEAKVQTILGVWSKHKVPKTVIKNDIKKNENVVPLDAILSGSDNSKNTTTNNIQSFFSNAA